MPRRGEVLPIAYCTALRASGAQAQHPVVGRASAPGEGAGLRQAMTAGELAWLSSPGRRSFCTVQTTLRIPKVHQ